MTMYEKRWYCWLELNEIDVFRTLMDDVPVRSLVLALLMNLVGGSEMRRKSGLSSSFVVESCRARSRTAWLLFKLICRNLNIMGVLVPEGSYFRSEDWTCHRVSQGASSLACIADSR